MNSFLFILAHFKLISFLSVRSMSMLNQVLSLIFSQSPSLFIYEVSIILSFLVHKLYFLSCLKETLRLRSWMHCYVLIITLLSSTNLFFIAIDDYLSSHVAHVLLILDSLFSGALVALLSLIYPSFCLIGHGLFTLVLAMLSKSSDWKSIELFDPCLTECLLITLNLLHGLYVLLNGVQTYMHRLVALSGMCMSFLIVLFQDDQQLFSMPSPIVIRHVLQSARSFFLYSVVICIRNRTSYWQK